jgi:hypothetical protein
MNGRQIPPYVPGIKIPSAHCEAALSVTCVQTFMDLR